MRFVSKINTRYLIVAILFFCVILSIQTFARRNAPDLSEVLKGSKFSLDLGFVAFGIFASLLATLSVAKSYEIFSRIKNKKEDPELEIVREENDRFSRINSDLTKDNEDLRRKILKLEERLSEKANHEEMLIRSAVNLKREFEKILAEKEKLVLEVNKLQLEANQQHFFSVKKSGKKPVKGKKMKRRARK